MDIHIVSIFPQAFDALTEYGVVGRAIKGGLCDVRLWNPRDFTADRHRNIDDRPYGGGPGMVMMAEPLAKTIDAAKAASRHKHGNEPKVIYLSPQGRCFNHNAAQQLTQLTSIIFVAGRYEGVDERLMGRYVDEQWSIGDYVLSGGELPAMVMIDAIVRQLPGSLGNEDSAQADSFVDGLLDYPHYTRPEVFENARVPDVLLSGDHSAIETWRHKQALGRTWRYRPDLLEERNLTEQEQTLLAEFKLESNKAK